VEIALNPTRRHVLRLGSLAIAAPFAPLPAVTPVLAQNEGAAPAAAAQGAAWRHGLSLFGELHYPPGFPHFDYVDPQAPKGGTVRLGAFGTFDNFNLVIAGVKGNLAAGISLINDTLLTSAWDEVSTEYGLIAEAVSYPADYSSAIYRLRTEAKWHDGKPITPDDVVYSFEVLKKNSPELSAYYRHVVKAERTGDREITFTFDQPGNRELPQIIGQLTILPKHWWEGTDSHGNKRDVTATTLEPPLGSGPYRVKEFTAARTVVYERVEDYWGRDLNVNVGRNNFSELRYDYYRDMTAALVAFTADQFDWRAENSAKNWATAYDFPAVRDKRVLKEEFPLRSRGNMQAFAFNIRRDKFKDPRVRRAFNFAFDFEEMNKQLFYNQYHRIDSYFDGTELASSALPQGAELEMLETVRDKVPPQLFTAPYTNPVGGNPEAVRANLREGLRLLKEAGFEVRNGKQVDAKTGEPLTVELLAEDPTFERVMLFYLPSLQRMGVAATVRTIDSSQYEQRLRQWDYDIIISSWPESLSPGNEQRGYWGSQAADIPGTLNLIGIKNPAVDALIDRIIFAKSRQELVAATRALDRVLLWNFYVVPQWTYPFARTARWDRFGRPAKLPYYNEPDFPSIWWWDTARAAKLGKQP
jgi:microcin C transport system substrate-binding protein